MTGFARAEGHDERGYGWSWEVKSVNSRGLDIRCRLPSGFDRLEIMVRAAVLARFERGAITVALAVAPPEGRVQLSINRGFLNQLMALHKELAGRVEASPPRLESLLAIRGVVEAVAEEETEEGRERRDSQIIVTLDAALDALAVERAAEGERLTPVLCAYLDEIRDLTEEAERNAPLEAEALKARLKAQVARLIEAEPSLPEDRLAQEAALLMTRADVREELDRLAAHVTAARGLIERDGPVGRRLDFLCQEFNREANTLCSKAMDNELTRIGLDLKAAIERLREQVQNIE